MLFAEPAFTFKVSPDSKTIVPLTRLSTVLDAKLICATSCSASDAELSVVNASTSILPE